MGTVVRHRPQRLSGTPFRVLDCPVAFTKYSQHGDRQPVESAFPVGAFLAPKRLSLQPDRRAACLSDR